MYYTVPFLLIATFFSLSFFAQSETVDTCGVPDKYLQAAWSQTDFQQCKVHLDEIMSGGPGKDGIPAIDTPVYAKVSKSNGLSATEPVISLQWQGMARAWPLRILTWHEIVNDTLAGLPIAVTYCPLCNAAIVFERTVDNRVLDFGTTGSLRHSDLVMYDRQTESWWQQYTGEAIIGEMTGKKLATLPARLESWGEYAARHPNGEVLVPNNRSIRSYGSNPYVGYDSSGFPFLYRGEVPDGIKPLERVVVVGEEAWALKLLQKSRKITSGGYRISWKSGQNSALDTAKIADGRDVGTVTVQRKHGDTWKDEQYHVTFAFVFHAFNPNKAIILDMPDE